MALKSLCIVLLITAMAGWGFHVYMNSAQSDHARLVASLVAQYEKHVTAATSAEFRLDRHSGWPDDFLLLQTWLMREFFQGREPSRISASLDRYSRAHYYSPVMKTSLRRWQASLARSHSDSLEEAPERMLEEGRRMHFEATGFRRIGRQYDASVLYLSTARHLMRFVLAKPDAQEVPEALYLMGDAFLRLRYALPGPVKPDRILNLVSEYYPHSVWAKQANLLWRSEMVNGI